MFDQNGKYIFSTTGQVDPETLRKEFASYKSADKPVIVREVEREEQIPWNCQRVTVAATTKSGLANIMEFIANYKAFDGKVDILNLYNNQAGFIELQPGTIRSRSMFSELTKEMLNELDVDDQLLGGWQYDYESGRIDEDTTCHSYKCVFETKNCYVFIDAYQETLH